jgi:hypothetical protein
VLALLGVAWCDVALHGCRWRDMVQHVFTRVRLRSIAFVPRGRPDLVRNVSAFCPHRKRNSAGQCAEFRRKARERSRSFPESRRLPPNPREQYYDFPVIPDFPVFGRLAENSADDPKLDHVSIATRLGHRSRREAFASGLLRFCYARAKHLLCVCHA